MKVICWLNSNSGFIMAILTLVYVIATILICVFNGKSAKATKEQTLETIKQFKNSNRPHIIPCFTMIEGAMFCLSFRNIGNGCAKDLIITINQEWLDSFNEALKQKAMPGNIQKSLENKFFIEPNGEIKFVLMIPGDGTKMYEVMSQNKIKINLCYFRNDLSEQFDEYFELDLLTMAGIILDKTDYIRKMEKQEKALKDISKSIQEVTKTIENIRDDSIE